MGLHLAQQEILNPQSSMKKNFARKKFSTKDIQIYWLKHCTVHRDTKDWVVLVPYPVQIFINFRLVT